MHNFEEIDASIRQKILSLTGNNTLIEIFDESSKHIGHAGSANYSVSHLRIHITSDYFCNIKKLERYRILHKTLDQEIKLVHSVTFVIMTFDEAAIYAKP
ncbi:BolA/IbaG family iron-sulfur metabolism protein [Anaplasma bovis]|uniref:BolA/IbaG family iron-sulfur metabolism protein n=1 Tax=Anaplasma bovis TaxID=186733 RepID=UPI002FF02B06